MRSAPWPSTKPWWEGNNERTGLRTGKRGLRELKLARVSEVLDRLAEDASRQQQTYLEFLDRLLAEEQAARHQRRVAMKTKLAHFAYIKTLDQFEFSFQPSMDERRIRELAALRFVALGENLILLGPPGVGKTHLAVALGVEAVAQGYNPYFITVPELLELLERDAKAGRLQQRMRAQPGLLILDEMGYLPISQMAAHFLFQLVARRYEKGSILPPATSPMANGARSLPTTSWPRPFSTAFYTTPRRSTSAAKATGCGRNARPESSRDLVTLFRTPARSPKGGDNRGQNGRWGWGTLHR